MLTEDKSASPQREKQARKFCCITYLSEPQIKACLAAHHSCIRGYAYMLHDKDDGKEPHYHIVLSLFSCSTISRIRRWFRAKDDDGRDITTTAQICGDLIFQYEYLWHRNDPDKYQYDPDNVVVMNPEIFTSESPDDQAVGALMDIKNGEPIYDVLLKYGRDVIFHYSHIRQILVDITLQEAGENPFKVDRRYH